MEKLLLQILVQIELLTSDFQVIESSTEQAATYQAGIHYRGIVQGLEHTLVAISVFDEEVMGVISSLENGNLVLGRLESEDKIRSPRDPYILYPDHQLNQLPASYCDMPDDGPGYELHELQGNLERRDLDDCIRIYFEVDNNIYTNKGGTTAATNYVEGLFNQVATLYANENINVAISEIFVWNTTSPYTSSNSSGMLNQFQSARSSFNGDLGQLLSYRASGGIAAGFSGLCNNNPDLSLSFSSIGSTYRVVPTYSFTVMVVTHEFGHLFGSRHTHACVWNGNNSAIDGCTQTEGFCRSSGVPSAGGTIMSYCHLTSAGINFNLGFGPQPGNLIRNRVTNANCLQNCGDRPPPPPSECEDIEVVLTINTDNYGNETSWEVLDSDNQVIYSGGGYANNTTYTETFCLEEVCYTLVLSDSYGDGICCTYGQGSYILRGPSGTIATGGEFANTESVEFCLGEDDNGGGEEDSCIAIDFNDYTINSYGGNQDRGTFTLLSNNTILKIEDNAWKSIILEYNITPNTVIQFDFGTTTQGEIHAIGFDDDNAISEGLTFQLFGTQSYGISDFNTYNRPGYWSSFTIPVGQFYTGSANRLFFVADHDNGPRNGNSFFRNIRIYEGETCDLNLLGLEASRRIEEIPTQMTVYPNPAQDIVQIQYTGPIDPQAKLQVFNVTGQAILTTNWTENNPEGYQQLDVSTLPPGLYLIRIDTGGGHLVQQLMITR